MRTSLCALAIVLVAGMQAGAAIVQFDLVGKAGSGLLAGNENGVVSGNFGSGGEVGAGITFDDVTNMLTINVAWGADNGFTNLTGNTIAGHLHGPTPSPAPGAFTENVGVKYGLDALAGWNSSASSGGFTGTISILPADVAPLLAGRFYFNAHTVTNGPGEIRGNLVVPEPAMMSLLACAGLLLRAKRRKD